MRTPFMSGLEQSLDLFRDTEIGETRDTGFGEIDHVSALISRLPRSQKILLLQGPVGSFFQRLQDRLNAEGIDAWHVQLNKADRFFNSREKQLRFDAGQDAWPQWLETELKSNRYTCIILFGCERPAHIAARKIAKTLGITVISIEEGYIRPGFISVEKNGNNAASPIAGKIPAEHISGRKIVEHVNFKKGKALYVYGAAYYAINRLFNSRHEGELNHRDTPIISECVNWIRNFAINLVARRRDRKAISDLTQRFEKKYYLVALQVAADSNLKAAALGWCSKRLVRESIASFAKDAPSGTRLVFKIHPMERGHNRLNPFIKEIARSHGVDNRVSIIEVGPLGLLAEHAAGLITINSTSGLSAIYHGTPLLVIGHAIYEHPELAMCSRGKPDFPAFWYKTNVAPHAFRRNYLSWLTDQALEKGDLYNSHGQDIAIEGIIRQIRVSTSNIA